MSRALSVCVFGLLMLVGCQPPVREVPAVYQNLKAISTAYLTATDDLGHPPRNMEELTPFLKRAGDPEKMLRSPNDGEPYVILWDIDYHITPVPVMIHEKTGKGGVRYVVRGRDIYRMTEQEFKSAPFPK